MLQEDEARFHTRMALNTILDYSGDESFFNADSSRIDNESFLEASINLGFVSGCRGSERDQSLDSSTLGFFCTEFDDNAVEPEKRLSLSKLDDSTFFDSDTGKEMLLKDQVDMEKELTLVSDEELNCTGCSSWVPVTSEKLSTMSLTMGNEVLRDRLCMSVGEYIATRTECLGSLSVESTHKRAYFGCDASTPAGVEKDVALMGNHHNELSTFSNLNTPQKKKSAHTRTTFPLSPDFLYSVKPKTVFESPKSENIDQYQYYIGATCYKKIQRLRAEEKIRNRNWLKELDDSELDTTIENLNCKSKNNSSHFGDETFLQKLSNSGGLSFGSSHGKDSIMEQWVVQPQEISLDVTKGSRVQMINNSTQDIKFKINFDAHVVNVSPIIGTIPAKNQIGLRILVSRALKYQKEGINETIIKIISGNRERTICVKIIFKASKVLIKKRSYILH